MGNVLGVPFRLGSCASNTDDSTPPSSQLPPPAPAPPTATVSDIEPLEMSSYTPGQSAYAVRRSADADQSSVAELDLPELATRKLFFGARASSQLGALIETSELALTLTDAHRADRVLGFCALDDKPPPLTSDLSDNTEAFRGYLHAKYELPRASTWLFLTYFAQKKQASSGAGGAPGAAGAAGAAGATRGAAGSVVLRQLLHAAYTALPHRQCVLLVLPISVELESDPSGLHKCFERVPPRAASAISSSSGIPLSGALELSFQEFAVYQSRASAFLPSVHVRRARVEDHDDLAPILHAHNESVARQFGDFFLAELIKDQDAHNVCLVAQASTTSTSTPKDPGATGRAVGLLAISDEIHVATLQQSFELDAYNNLAKSEPTTTSSTTTTTSISPPQIVICGPPAGGKGTQCELLVEEFGVVHLSTGDMLRASIQRNSPLGLQAQRFMDAGELVPDALIIDVMLERLQQRDCVARGWLLDGFPRTASQAQAMLRLGLVPDSVVVLDVPDEEVVKRISGRRVDPETGKTYHLEFNPPPPQDDALRLRLIQRSDDTEATIRNRLVTFHNNCDLVVETFRHTSQILTVNGLQPKQSIAELVIEQIHGIKNAQKFKYLVSKRHLAAPKLVITGPPAGGKGTQCELLVEMFGVVHLSTGDMLRASIQQGATLGMKAKAFMDAGELVPDELIIDVILERLQQHDCETHGWLLDGFPRTAVQASAMLAQGIVPDAVLVLDVPDEEVVKRISGRRVDPVTGKTYHIEFNPPPPEICDRVVQRSDDTETTVLNRLEKFHANCDAVLTTFAESSSAEESPVQIVRCDGLQPKQVIAQSFSAPIFQKMVDAEATVALQYTSTDLDSVVSAAGVGGAAGGAATASASLWKSVENARAQYNCFAITLFSMDDRYDGVAALDLVANAFAAFPERDFCLLTLPTSAPEPSFLRVFTLVPPQATSTFTHVLYVLHRDAIAFFHATTSDGQHVLDAVEISVARYVSSTSASDMSLLQSPLLQSVAPATRASIEDELVLAREELEIELDENPKNAVFLVRASSGQVVGVAVLARDHEVTSALRHHFHLDSLLLMAHHRSKDHAIVQHFVLNPVFYAAARFVLLEISRLFRKSCLFVQVPTDNRTQKRPSSISPVLHDFVLAPPRRSIAISSDEVALYPEDAERVAQLRAFDAFALFVVSKKLLSEPKLSVNHRVVVVGASDTALVCLQRLLSVPYLRFTNITLISPLGMDVAPSLEPNPLLPETKTTVSATATATTSHSSGVDPLAFARKSAFTRAELDQFSLRTHVRVIESKVMQIDRQARAVLLMDGSCLPYDYLLLTAGLQDGTSTSLGRFPVFDGDQYVPAAIPPTMVPLGDVKTARVLHQQLRDEREQLPSEQLQHRRIAVYGSSLFALQVIQGLVATGVDGSRIIHLSPARDSVFEDTQIKNEIDKEYAKHGVTVQYNTKIASLVVSSSTNDLEAVHTVAAVGSHNTIGESNHQSSTHQSSNPQSTVPCAWLLCCQHNDADYDMFRAINESGLVYDGRLVVNGHMRTTDPFILAAGSLCRFSRRFIHAKLHEHYNARECGELLASSLLKILDPLAVASSAVGPSASTTHADDAQLSGSSSRKSLANSSSAPSLGNGVTAAAQPGATVLSPTAAAAVVPPPEMHMPVVRTATVLGGKSYVQISIPTLTNTLSLQVLPTRASQTAHPRYTCLLFDDYGVLNRLEYLGEELLEIGNLQCLVGMHESYLNSAVASFANAFVDDWISFFRQKWASALYHDRFAEFCVRLHGFLRKDDGVRQLVEDVSRFFSETGDVKGATAMAQVRVGRGGEALVPSTKRIIESQALEFLSANREILAMYLLPRAAGKKTGAKPGTATATATAVSLSSSSSATVL